MRSLVVSFLACLPTLVSAQVWGDENGCRIALGNPPESDLAFILRPDRIERYESICPIVAVTPLDGGSVRLTTECSGEGETWPVDYVLLPWNDRGRLQIHDAEYPEYKFKLGLCE